MQIDDQIAYGGQIVFFIIMDQIVFGSTVKIELPGIHVLFQTTTD